MPVSSDGVAIGLITAVQTDTGVWVRRAVSAVARSRCHLVCHWLRDLLPSKYRLVGHAEPRSRRDHSATTGGPGAGTGVGAAPADAGQSLSIPQAILHGPRVATQLTKRSARGMACRVSTTGHTRPAAETSAAPGRPRRRYRRPDRAQTGPRRPDSEYGIAAYRVPRARSAAMNEFWHGTGSPSRPKLSRLTVSTLSSYPRHVFHACQCGGPSGVSCRGWWSRPDSDAGYPQYGGHMAAVLDLSYWIRWGSASAVRSVSPRPGTPGSGRMTPPAGSSVPSKNSDSIRT